MSKACCELNLEQKLVHHASPTLAGIKPANLFVCHNCSCNHSACGCSKLAHTTFDDAFLSQLSKCRRVLTPLGINIEVLAKRKTGPLVYVYRPNMLRHILLDERIRDFLKTQGYTSLHLSACIERLHKRICGTDLAQQLTGGCSFPHEIGIFLGYPLDDVIGFIENEGENYLCQGCWKVYSNERDAQECFCSYKECTASYKSLYEEGIPLECLATQEPGWEARCAFGAAS